MKRAVMVVVLGFGVWSAPVWATSFKGENAPGEAPREDWTGAKHDDILRGLLRFEVSTSSSNQPKPHFKPSKWVSDLPRSVTPPKGHKPNTGPVTPPNGHKPHPNANASIVAPVPEPSALMLFGVGYLITRRALARRDCRAESMRKLLPLESA